MTENAKPTLLQRAKKVGKFIVRLPQESAIFVASIAHKIKQVLPARIQNISSALKKRIENIKEFILHPPIEFAIAALYGGMVGRACAYAWVATGFLFASLYTLSLIPILGIAYEFWTFMHIRHPLTSALLDDFDIAEKDMRAFRTMERMMAQAFKEANVNQNTVVA